MKRLLLLVALLSLPALGCRTAGTFDGVKRAICKAETGIGSAVDAAASPFGLPGTVAGGIVKTLLGLVCSSVEVAADAAKGVTSNLIDVPTQAVGSVLGVGGEVAPTGGTVVPDPAPAPPHP